jgi:biopolymer transport protein ExbD
VVTSLWSILCAVLVSIAVAFAKPVPEKFEHANLPDVTRTQDKLGARSGVVDAGVTKGVLVVVTPNGILVGGKTLVKVSNGAVDAADKEADTTGRFIPRLTASVPAMTAADPNGAVKTVMLGVDRTSSYQLLSEVVYSLAKAHASVHVLVHAGGSVHAVPLALGAKIDDDLGMVVAATKTEVLVFSRWGKEGSMAKPLARIALDDTKGDAGRSDAAMKVRSVLEKVAKKWAAKKNVVFGKTVALVADETTSMQFVADLMVAARAHLPNLVLVTGTK